jgi:predicted RNA-binding Zn-ribbon protein involved in translation (DUF1610 family)
VKQRKPPDWLIEERRSTLGQWAAFCVGCGYTQRYFEELESELPERCPECGGQIRSRCSTCRAQIASAVAVECESCGGALRPPDLFGTPIRRAK